MGLIMAANSRIGTPLEHHLFVRLSFFPAGSLTPTFVIRALIGLIAAIKATIVYFTLARDNSTSWPFWLSVVVFVLLVLGVVVSLLRTFAEAEQPLGIEALPRGFFD